MALENIGLGGVLTFNGAQGVAGMNQATAATGRLAKAQTGLGAVVSKIGGGFSALGGFAMNMGLALAPVTAAFAFGANYAAQFEKAMSGVKAVAEASAEDMAALTLAAKKFGATTAYGPVEVAGGMEELARAGFNAKQTLDAIPGVLAAAAAEGMPLSDATNYITSALQAMGLAASDSTRVADVYALASAKTNASIASLGEGMKYAAAQSKIMGINLETTVGVLGLASDAGLQGTLAGTSYANMLVKLAKPTKAATKFFKEHQIQMTKTKEGGLDIVDVTKQISAALDKENDVLKKGALLQDIFGAYGKKMFGALQQAVKTGKIDTIVEDLMGAKGAAERMATTRLEGVLGSLKQIGNAAKAMSIEIFSGLLGDAGPHIAEFGKAFGRVVNVLQLLNSSVTTNRKELEREFGPTAVAIAFGIADAVKTIRARVEELRNSISALFNEFGGKVSPEMIQSVTKWIVLLGGVAAAAGPVMLAMAGVIRVVSMFGPLLTVVEMLGSAIIALGPAILGVGTIFAAVFVGMRAEGESTRSVLERMWTTAGDLAIWFRDTAAGAWDVFTTTLGNAVEKGKIVFFNFVERLRGYWQEWFGAVVRVLQKLEPLFSAIFKIIAKVVAYYVQFMSYTFREILYAIEPVAKAIKDLAIWILDKVLWGLQKVVKLAVKAADALNLSKDSPIWADLAAFASQPEISLTGDAGKAANVAAAQTLGLPDLEKEFPKMEDAGVFAKQAADISAINRGAIAKPSDVNVDVKLEDQRKLDIKNCVQVDGREMAVAQGRHQQEVNERAGFKATPWQRRQIVEQGAVAVAGGM